LVKVGVLALQGDFDAHRRRLAELGASVSLVREARELAAVDALVIPGGESTTFVKLLGEDGFGALCEFVANKPTFGTCAGAILLARDVENPPSQRTLAALDVRIRRNAYGRQLESSIRRGEFQGTPMEMVFIRAPIFERVGPGIEVLAEFAGKPALVQKGHILAAAFHPELTDDSTVHQHFLQQISSNGSGKKD
jgi:5'-phosphate synthase pdxT subunit